LLFGLNQSSISSTREEVVYKTNVHNLFHGKGKELGADYAYIGSYYNGYRTQGELKWTVDEQQYIYDGHFNFNNQFHGEGQLTEPMEFIREILLIIKSMDRVFIIIKMD